MKKVTRESGFTLLELLLVVGVGALLIIGGIATYRMVVEGTRVNDSVRILTTIKQEAQQLYQGQNNYGAAGADLTPILQNIKALPNSLLHPFNDAITVTVAGDNTHFEVDFANVPSSACNKLAKSMLEPTDVEQISIGGAVILDNAALSDPATDFVGLINPACGTNIETNITWEFR